MRYSHNRDREHEIVPSAAIRDLLKRDFERVDAARKEGVTDAVIHHRFIQQQQELVAAEEQLRILAENTHQMAAAADYADALALKKYEEEKSILEKQVTSTSSFLRASEKEVSAIAKEVEDARLRSSPMRGQDRSKNREVSEWKTSKRKASAKKQGKLVSDEAWSGGEDKRNENRKSKISAATRLIADEASYPIPFKLYEYKHRGEISGVSKLPAGAFVEPVIAPAKHAEIYGGTGVFAKFDYTKKNNFRAVADAVQVSKINTHKAGQPPNHLGHIVLSKPLGPEGGLQKFDQVEGMRMARHALVGIGADPNAHDFIVIHHSSKKEEALHLLYIKTNKDGLFHDNKNAFVSLALARARWDDAAGIDPSRIGQAEGKSKLVRDGYKAVRERKLSAEYRDFKSSDFNRVELQGSVHAMRIAEEGSPEVGQCAGTWTPKPGYRNDDEVRAIFFHVLNGD